MKFFSTMFMLLCLVPARASDEGERVFGELEDHVRYSVSEPRLPVVVAGESSVIIHLCREVDRLAILEEEGVNDCAFPKCYSAQLLAVRAFSFKITEAWVYWRQHPPVLNSCFIADPATINQDDSVLVNRVSDKPHLTLGAANVAKVKQLAWMMKDTSAPQIAARDDLPEHLAFSAFKEQAGDLVAYWFENHCDRSVCFSKKTCLQNSIEDEAMEVENYAQVYACLRRIIDHYDGAINLLGYEEQDVLPCWDENCNPQDVKVSQAMDNAIDNLTAAKNYYENLLQHFQDSREIIMTLIRNPAMRNQACIEDPLYARFCDHLRVPSLEKHIYLNGYWHAIVEKTLVPLFKKGWKYVLLPVAGMTILCAIASPIGLIWYGLLTNAGFSTAVSGLAGGVSTGGFVMFTLCLTGSKSK